MRIIFLCGFMGCGKSTLLKQLAGSVETVDLDDHVTEKYLKPAGFNSIADCVVKADWNTFRSYEKQAVMYVLGRKSKDVVVALGGGSLTEELLALIVNSENAELVWLDETFEICWERIKDDESRPLVAQGRESLCDLFKSRKALYSQADCVLRAESVKKIQNYKSLIIAVS